VRWEERLLRELDDLELQAEGLALAERDATVVELGAAQYAEVALADRIHASLGSEVRVRAHSGAVVEGRLVRAGRDWLLVVHGPFQTVVNAAAVCRLAGLSARAVPEGARPVGARLTMGSVLRQLAASGQALAVCLRDGSSLRARLKRVGTDFVEVSGDALGPVELVPFAALESVRVG
jgi:hypothetical protein